MSRSNFFKNSIPPKGLWIKKKKSGMQCSKTYLKTLCVCFTYRGEELTIQISQAVVLNAVLAPCLFVCLFFSFFPWCSCWSVLWMTVTLASPDTMQSLHQSYLVSCELCRAARREEGSAVLLPGYRVCCVDC